MTEAAEKSDLETVAAWMIRNGFATGHGLHMDDLLYQLGWQIRERVEHEREQCALTAMAVTQGTMDGLNAVRQAAVMIRLRPPIPPLAP